MDNNTSVLLVEGQADVDFFEALLRRLKLLEKFVSPCSILKEISLWQFAPFSSRDM